MEKVAPMQPCRKHTNMHTNRYIQMVLVIVHCLILPVMRLADEVECKNTRQAALLCVCSRTCQCLCSSVCDSCWQYVLLVLERGWLCANKKRWLFLVCLWYMIQSSYYRYSRKMSIKPVDKTKISRTGKERNIRLVSIMYYCLTIRGACKGSTKLRQAIVV